MTVGGPFNINLNEQVFDGLQMPQSNIIPVANAATYKGANDSTALAVTRATSAAGALGVPLYIPPGFPGGPSLSLLTVNAVVPVPPATGVAATDTAAILRAHNAAVAAGGGVVTFPSGVYIVTDLTTPNQSTAPVIWQGAGMDATIIRSSASSTDHAVSVRCRCVVNDMTFDGNNVAPTTFFLLTPNGGATIDTAAFNRVRFTNNLVAGTGWVFAAWDQGATAGNSATYHINNMWMEDCIIDGPSATAEDAAAWTGVINLFVNNLVLRNLSRTPNFYSIANLYIDGMVATGFTGSAGGVVIDALTGLAMISNVICDLSQPAIFNCPQLFAQQCYFATTPHLAQGAAASPVYHFADCVFLLGMNVYGQIAGLQVIGGSITTGATNGVVNDTATAATIHSGIIFTGVDININGGGLYGFWVSFNGTTINGPGFSNCRLHGSTGFTLFFNATVGAGFAIRNSPGINPFGQVHAPGTACPASGTAITAVPYDSMITISNGVNALTAAITATGGGTSISYTVAASAVQTFQVPAGQTLTPTYGGGAPTYAQQGL